MVHDPYRYFVASHHMGNSLSSGGSPKCVNFEYMLERYSRAILITTMNPRSIHRIKHTLSPENEVNTINRCLDSLDDVEIIVYGLNCADTTVFEKYEQLVSFGFTNVSIYCGGLFEWLLLQDIYGNDTFQTNRPVDDMLKYK
jgi:hypothetical protein